MRESSPLPLQREIPGGSAINPPASTPPFTEDPWTARSCVYRMLASGFLAGTLDIAAACLINRARPSVVLHMIASGLVGKSAFGGGLSTVVLGLILQWGMSILIAAVFIAAARIRPTLTYRWVRAGLAYGLVVFTVMNYVVVPLSAIGYVPLFKFVHFLEDMIAMLLFGLIVAFFSRRLTARSASGEH